MVLVRFLLALPHLLWSSVWFLVVLVVLPIAWIAGLVLGQVPAPLHGFVARYLRHSTHTSACANLLAEPFPGFTGAPGYPVDLEVDAPAPQNRVVTALRLLLALPALILDYLLGELRLLASVLLWFTALALGRVPEGLRNLSAYTLRYHLQTQGYLLLLAPAYPSLSTEPSAGAREEESATPVACPNCGEWVAGLPGDVALCENCGARVVVG